MKFEREFAGRASFFNGVGAACDGASCFAWGNRSDPDMGKLRGASAEMVNVFECSLARCLESGDFTEAFYQRFLASSDDVRLKFAHTDLSKQKKVLESSLYLMARAMLGIEDGLEHLESVARSHSRKQLDIAPSHYDLWLSALIATSREFDPEFTVEVEHAWRELLQIGIERMVAVYRGEPTVPPARGGRGR